MASGDEAPEGIQIDTQINSLNPITWWKTARFIRKQKPNIVMSGASLEYSLPLSLTEGEIASAYEIAGQAIAWSTSSDTAYDVDFIRIEFRSSSRLR